MDFSFKRETVYIACNYLDRYLSRVSVKKSILQLVGITCLFIASKMEVT